MNNIKHFEDLWNECEKLFTDESLSDLNNEFTMKALLIKKLLESADNLSTENKIQYNEAVSKLFGEILFSLSKIASKLNVNVFKSLMLVYNINNIDYLENKYKNYLENKNKSQE